MADTLTDRGRRTRAEGNPFGIAEALLGLAGGLMLSILAIAAYDGVTGTAATAETFGQNVVSLISLWTGFVGAAIVASRLGAAKRDPSELKPTKLQQFVDDYGFRIKPWPDVPLGIAVGVGAQFLLVPLLELPLRPFVPHLDQRLGHPARQLLGPANSGGTGQLVVISLLICLGSPIVEELFFRGLLLRGLLGRLAPLGPRLGPAISIVATGLLFALVHFEGLQFLGLAGLGIVLGFMAWRSGRLGPSIITHIAFNATTVIAYVLAH